MAKVRELFTVWGFEVDMKPLERLDQAIETTKGALKSIAVTAAAAGGSVFGLVKFTANAGDHALKMAQKVGIGVESLQELAFAAELSDLSAEELQQNLTILSKKAVEAARGSAEALRPFTQLGIHLRDSSGRIKGTDQLLADFADRFSKLPDGPRKTALAVDAFGRSGANLIPFLNQGSAKIAELRKEAQALGIVFSEDQAKASEEFNDNLKRLMASMIGIRNIVGNELIPVFSELLVELKEMVLGNRDLIATNVKEFVGVLITLFKNMLYIMLQTARITRNIAILFGGAANAAKIFAFALSLLLGLKLAFGLGQGVLALVAFSKGLAVAGNAALIAQAKLLLIPLAIAGIIAAIALVAEDFLTFSQGGNSVVGLLLKGLDEMFATLAQKAGVFGSILHGIFIVLVAPIRGVINLLGLVGDLMSTIFGNKTFVEFFKGAGSRMLNIVKGSAFTDQGILGDFGLAPPPLPGSAGAPTPSPATLQARNVAVSQIASIDVNVTGLPPDVAESVARSAMTDSFENVLRQTGREAESSIER